MSRQLDVLITGDRGYIGSVMSTVLTSAGHRVAGVDSLLFEGCDLGSVPAPGRPAVDIRDITVAHLEGFDAVVHLAALSNDPMGDLDPELTYDVNLRGSEHLARTAKRAGVRRFVFASSCSMYGATDAETEIDESAPLKPLTPYAESKARFEDVLWMLADQGFEPVAMRNATAYGFSPRLRLDIVVNNLTAWAHAVGTIRLQSNGLSWRPLVHVDDICRATATLIGAPASGVAGQAFNIGGPGENYLVRDLAALVRSRYPSCEISFADGAGADPRSYRVSFDRFAHSFPDHRFVWGVTDGIDELAASFTRHDLRGADLTGDRYIRLHRLLRRLRDRTIDDDLRPRAS